MAPFPKAWASCADLVTLLESRGLIVDNRQSAELFIREVGYYRFSGYFLAFEHARHAFRAGTSFGMLRAAYEFDVVLRDLVTEALEVLEIDFRASITHHIGQHHGAFCHTDPARFIPPFTAPKAHLGGRSSFDIWLSRLQDEAKRSSELFIKHFKATYSEFPNLPIWVTNEVMSFGSLSLMYANLNSADQTAIATRYRLRPTELAAVMHHFVYVRNLCAHHARLWDRMWTIKPPVLRAKKWQPPLVPSVERVFVTLLILYELMRKVVTLREYRSQWRTRLMSHLADPPNCHDPDGRLGLPASWWDHPVWHDQ